MLIPKFTWTTCKLRYGDVYFVQLTDLKAIQPRHFKLNGTGWLTMDPSDLTRYGSKWKTTDFAAGDVLIFSMQTLHMSTTNMTNKARISCDTRWQPSSEPLDPRYTWDRRLC